MKTSWKRLQAFSFFTQGFQVNGQQMPGWLTLHPEETKFAYAIKRVNDQIKQIGEDIQAKLDEIDIDNCAVDERQVIIRNLDGSLAFTQAGLKTRNVARKGLINTEDIEIEPYYATEVPELKEGEREILTNFVIKEEEISTVA